MVTILVSLIVLTSLSIWTAAQGNDEYREELNTQLRDECKGLKGKEKQDCWSDNSPDKCEDLVYSNISEWALCITTCENEGWFSRTFGECSL